jgi:hypothetical protein
MTELIRETATDDVAIRERLNRLVAERSQSEIARRTNTGVAAVNRYVHGARIPAAFCAALVRGLGVNPAWLLMGEGAPYLADVHGDTVKLGENMLELVEAMSAASQMLLGSLTGQHHLKLLRELNEALLAHERLREKMNQQSRPVFEKVLDQLDGALNNLDLERSVELIKAAQQVSRLCDDDILTDRLLEMQARYEFMRKNSERVLEIDRKRFLRLVSRSGVFDEDAVKTGRQIAIALSQMDRIPESLRVCRAVRALASSEVRKQPIWHAIENTYGLLLFEMGKLDRGLGVMRRCVPHLTGKLRVVCEAHMVRGMLYSNTLSATEAMHVGGHNDAKAQYIVRFATFMLDREALESGIQYARRQDLEPVFKSTAYLSDAQAILDQLVKPSAQAAAQAVGKLEPSGDDWPSSMLFARNVAACEVFRLAGEREEATRYLEQATANLSDMLPEYLPQPQDHAAWARAVLDLQANVAGEKARKQRRRARRVLKRYIRHGFQVFETALG